MVCSKAGQTVPLLVLQMGGQLVGHWDDQLELYLAVPKELQLAVQKDETDCL